MLRLAVARITLLVVACLVVSVAAFLLPYLVGGDPARTVLRARVGDAALDPETLAAVRAQLGLDGSLPAQYWAWARAALRGDFGTSFVSRTAVGPEVLRAAAVSMSLALSAMGLALAVALPVGTLVALRPGGRLDEVATFVTQSLVAVPEYWLAPVAVLVFSLHLGLLPSAGWHGPSYVVLPALVLSLRPMAYLTSVTRAAMIDVLRAPYITAARSRGLSMAETVVRHGLRNGALPILTLFALWLASLIGGSVVIEVIFSIPGMGRLVYEGIVSNDVPVLQASFVLIVLCSVSITTLADVLGVALNPLARADHGR